MPIRYHLDENVDHAVARGLQQRGIDVTTSTDVQLVGVSDKKQLEYARLEGRVLVTHDNDHLRLHHQGFAHAGIAYMHVKQASIGILVRALSLLHRTRTAEHMQGQIEFL